MVNKKLLILLLLLAPITLTSIVEGREIVHAVTKVMDKREVYYMNIKAGTTKGDVTSGDSLIAATTGHASGEAYRKYASDRVVGENIGTGDGADKTWSHTCARKPVKAGSVTLSYTVGSTTYTVTDVDGGSGTGTFTQAATLTSGSIVYATGVITLVFSTAPDLYSAIDIAEYRFDVETDTDGIGELNIEVTSANVDAEVFPLKLQYTVFSAINLQKIHGLVLADEGMKFATQEIRFAIDQVVLETAKTAAQAAGAATGPGAFSATVGSGQEWIWKMHEIKKYFSIASNNIFKKTLRATGNVIVCGMSVISIIEQLQDFKPAGGLGTKPPAGPYVAGTLGNRVIVANPFYTDTEYVMLFRGDNYLFAGLIFAPYVPLYSTDPVTLANLTTQRGFFSQAAIKRINDGMFTRGTVSGYS